MESKALLLGNVWKNGTGPFLESHNPINGQLLWHGQSVSADQVDDAVENAQEAFVKWSLLPLTERITLLENFKKILETEKNAFAKIISQETGKPLWESINEVDSMIGKVKVSIDAYPLRTGVHQQTINDVALLVRHKPHGVMAVIGPYNLPGHLPNAHIVPALLAGNTLVYKPSELTPLVGECMMRYWQLAGLPEGVMNFVVGGAAVGKTLIANPAVKGILFTGSYQTGKQIHEALAGQPERMLALEMGGNNPLIVHDIDDMNAAVLMTILSAYLTSGQRCTCTRRLIVVENKQSSDFLHRLSKAIEKIPVNVFDASPAPFMGSVITPQVAEKLLATQEELIAKGAQAIVKMNLLMPNTGLLTPGLIDVTAVKNREDKEIFGPLLQIIRVKNFDEALTEANNTSYGLAAGLLSKSIENFEKFYATIQAGIINWNRPTTGASSNAPFGGIKNSGNSRPSAYYAADYCAYPVASMETAQLKIPEQLPVGLEKVL